MYDITYSIHVTSYPLYLWHHIHYVSQHCVWLIPHSAYVWHHLHYRRHHIHSITPSYNLYDFTSTSGMTSHPLYQTSHPRYLCHHNLSTDIIPNFVWHHIHYVWQHSTVCCWYHTRHMCDIICTTHDITSTVSHQTTVFMMSHPLQAWPHTHSFRHCTHCIFVITTSPLISYPLLYDIIPTLCVTSNALYIISTPYVITLLYLWHHSHYIWNHIQYVGPQIHYTLVTSQPLICVITLTLLTTSHTLCMISHSDNIWHLLHYTRHHILA